MKGEKYEISDDGGACLLERSWASCITKRHLKERSHKMAVKTRLLMRHLDVKV